MDWKPQSQEENWNEVILGEETEILVNEKWVMFIAEIESSQVLKKARSAVNEWTEQ